MLIGIGTPPPLPLCNALIIITITKTFSMRKLVAYKGNSGVKSKETRSYQKEKCIFST